MSRSIIAAIVLARQDLPAGLVAGQFEVTLSTDGAQDVVQTIDAPTDATPPTITFADLAPGDYAVAACRLAATGERISSPARASITVPPPEQVDVPTSITLALA